MRRGIVPILLLLIAVFPSGISAQIERPSWALDTEPANFPAEVESIVFPNGFAWDGAHPSIHVGRWQISRSGPLTEYLSTDLMHHPSSVTCPSPTYGACFYASIRPLSCHNPADPALNHCTMSLSWTPDAGARCAFFVAYSTPYLDNPVVVNPRDINWFGVPCPAEIRFVR